MLVFSLVFALTSCARKYIYKTNLMPAPEIYIKAQIDPFSDKKPFDEMPYKGILYATDRLPADQESLERFYQNKRGYVLRLGVGMLKIGREDIPWEEVRRISLLKKRTKVYPLGVTSVDEFGIFADSHTIFTTPQESDSDSNKPAEKFIGLINKKLAISKQKDIFIYVHGYMAVFEKPLLVASQLWHFLGYDGVFIAYAWPSEPRVLAYASDIESTSLTANNLRIFLEYLALNTDADNIHIIGHSAGTRVVINTLFQLLLEHKGQERSVFKERFRIGHVILAASDFDRDLFGTYLYHGLLNVVGDFTIYMSGGDKSLRASRWFLGRRRLGQLKKDDEMKPGVANYFRSRDDIVLIDSTDAKKALEGKGHFYFRYSPWVSSDILINLMYSLSAQERGLVKAEELPVWEFPPDYIERLKSSLIDQGIK